MAYEELIKETIDIVKRSKTVIKEMLAEGVDNQSLDFIQSCILHKKYLLILIRSYNYRVEAYGKEPEKVESANQNDPDLISKKDIAAIRSCAKDLSVVLKKFKKALNKMNRPL